MTTNRQALTGGVVLALLVLTACTGGAQGPDESPEEVLAAAKARLDETSGVRLTLETDELPPAVRGVLRAEGIGTHDPAFEGELRMVVGGVEFDVPVVAAQGRVFAELPFTTEFVELDPSEYGAPDPADLMDPEGGLSSLLTEAAGVAEGDRVRSGEDVLASYSGTVPGEVVAAIIPSASAATDFAATFTVDDDGRLRTAVLTGPFYPDAEEITYTVSFADYGTTADIVLP